MNEKARPSRRFTRATAIVACSIAAVAGCGRSSDHGPQQISPDLTQSTRQSGLPQCEDLKQLPGFDPSATPPTTESLNQKAQYTLHRLSAYVLAAARSCDVTKTSEGIQTQTTVNVSPDIQNKHLILTSTKTNVKTNAITRQDRATVHMDLTSGWPYQPKDANRVAISSTAFVGTMALSPSWSISRVPAPDTSHFAHIVTFQGEQSPTVERYEEILPGDSPHADVLPLTEVALQKHSSGAELVAYALYAGAKD